VKKLIVVILLLLLGISAFSQKQKVNFLTTFDDKLIHFGFTIGLNTLDFNVVNYNPIGENPDFVFDPTERWPTAQTNIRSDMGTLIPGFTVGIISSLRLTEDFNLRFLPGLSFGERQITYNVPVIDINNYEPTQYYSVKSTFLDFPLLIKYKARRINNDRPYLVFGGAYRQDISRTAQEDLVKLKKSGFYAELGGGWDHYLPFFRFSVELKFSYGLNNQLGDLPAPVQKQYFAQSIKDLRSKIFTLSFHFE
jgi:hypothetical protein